MSTDLVHASLFTGIGGFDRGLELAGIPTVAACERDRHCRAVYKHHAPDVPMSLDVRTMTGDDLTAAGFVPARGILTAGFPCQDLSIAGTRRGIHGSRSGLFWHIVRLAAATRPRWIVLENVAGILSAVCPCPGDGACQRTPYARRFRCAGEVHAVGDDGCCVGGCMVRHGGVMGSVLGALAELGYGLAYRVLDAQHFGIPQRRPRVFIVGCAAGSLADPVSVLFEPELSGGSPTTSRPQGTPPPTRTEDGARAGRGFGIGDPSHVAAALVTNEQGGVRTTDLSGGFVVFSPTAGLDCQPHDRIAPGLKHANRSGMPAVADGEMVRRLTPLECERLQGFPDGWTTHGIKGRPQYDAMRYRQLGNAVAPPVVEWIGRRLVAADKRLNDA